MYKIFILWIYRSTISIIAIILSIWTIFLLVYILAPSEVTDNLSEDMNFTLTETYRPTVRWIESSYKAIIGSRSRDMWEMETVIPLGSIRDATTDATTTWSQTCYANLPQSPDRDRLTRDIFNFVFQLAIEKKTAKQEIDRLKSINGRFTVIVIFLGMFTSVFAGLNSSEYAQLGKRHAGLIKVAAITFPAAVTAVTALSSLFSSQDQIAKQTQYTSDLSV